MTVELLVLHFALSNKHIVIIFYMPRQITLMTPPLKRKCLIKFVMFFKFSILINIGKFTFRKGISSLAKGGSSMGPTVKKPVSWAWGAGARGRF